MKTLAPWILGLCLATGLQAAKMNPLFTDHAVLQRDAKVVIWGKGADGEKVTVEIAGQKAQTVVKDGKWQVVLNPHQAGGPFTLVMTSDTGKVQLEDVVFGDVFLISGQSNMERQLGPRSGQKKIQDEEKEVRAAEGKSAIRHFLVKNDATADQPKEEVSGGTWIDASPGTVSNFSAVGWFFADAWHEHAKVPVGLLHASWGGTPAQTWMSPEALRSVDPGAFDKQEKAVADYAGVLEKWKAKSEEILAAWAETNEQRKADGKPALPKPAAPKDPAKAQGRPNALWNGMWSPTRPYAVRAALWYQGEADSFRGAGYGPVLKALIEDWRKAKAQPDLPFFFVQIAPFRSASPALREGQRRVLFSTPRTAMAVTLDVGDSNDIHPTNKRPVGERLALAARHFLLGEKLDYTGPMPSGMKAAGDDLVLSFSNAAGHLELRGAGNAIFETAGADGKYAPVPASARGSEVHLTGAGTAKSVRYGWGPAPSATLFGGDGLPAAPFVFPDDAPIPAK